MRGFSLFTPLVGTALMITAILASVTIVQNDVRLSRAITASYVASSTATNAKIILATTEISTAEGVKDTVLAFLSGKSDYSRGRNWFQEVECGASNCYNDIKKNLDGTPDSPGIADFLNDRRLYESIITGVSTSTDYAAILPDDYYEKLGGKLASVRPGTVEFNSAGRLHAFVDKDLLEACCGELLTVEFQDENNPGNRVKLKVAPKEAEYTSSRNLKTIFENAGRAFPDIAGAVRSADWSNEDEAKQSVLRSADNARLYLLADDTPPDKRAARADEMNVYTEPLTDGTRNVLVVVKLDMDSVTVTLALLEEVEDGYPLGIDLPGVEYALVSCSANICSLS